VRWSEEEVERRGLDNAVQPTTNLPTHPSTHDDAQVDKVIRQMSQHPKVAPLLASVRMTEAEAAQAARAEKKGGGKSKGDKGGTGPPATKPIHSAYQVRTGSVGGVGGIGSVRLTLLLPTHAPLTRPLHRHTSTPLCPPTFHTHTLLTPSPPGVPAAGHCAPQGCGADRPGQQEDRAWWGLCRGEGRGASTW